MTTALTNDQIDSWADDPDGPVALVLKQKLLPVEGEGAVIFPPTYADIGYNIDTLPDGTKVATIDSVGSQANRMEPLFKHPGPFADLVPQVDIELRVEADDGSKRAVTVSLLDLAHRSADAVVMATPKLLDPVTKAFAALSRGDAWPLTCLAPTSLVFGVWDSRGTSGQKRPRLVRSVIRAHNVTSISSAAQFNSIWKQLDVDQQESLEKEAKAKKTKLSNVGFADAPATFRRVGAAASKYMPEYTDGAPNPQRRVLGGVVSQGDIERTVTINLIALRALAASEPVATTTLRRYLLALSLLSATAELDLFLREGCLLRYAGQDQWSAVPRRGDESSIDLSSPAARKTLADFTTAAANAVRPSWTNVTGATFDLAAAKKLLAKKAEQDGEPV
jgi:CRISPR-associated protein Csb1